MVAGMSGEGFHHPDICWPILRRQIGEQVLDLFVWYLELVASGGRSLHWNRTFPDRKAYHNAVYRLKKAGLIAYRRRGDNEGVLELTEAGVGKIRREFRPFKWWKRKWRGTWFLLVYDVPEKNRAYRDALRGFLQRLRMGCLQRSVYITPFDVRPEYEDLKEAAGTHDYSALFEAQAMSVRDPQEIVLQAWDFESICNAHDWFLKTCENKLSGISEMPKSELEIMAREEMSAYITIMAEDPLLPRELWPAHYRGEQVFAMHKTMVHAIAAHLAAL